MTIQPLQTGAIAPPFSDVLMTTAQAAAALGLSPRTLDAWRCSRRGGPAWIKCGSRVRYRKSDVSAWLETHTRQITGDQA
ncbi:helix-turn-helix domain-containing protein [Pseudomonas segetis]|uniref:helix-turn-helix domain-containing protein n=1 Tax=Pseudomonas segetis TaxID=298908 RepID=UPI000B771367